MPAPSSPLDWKPTAVTATPATDTVLDRLADGARTRGPAPVERWDPPECGPVDIAIAADGSWWHEGRPIRRDALVKLFASVLRKDADGTTWLVTPVEKCRVRVADVAFLAVAVAAEGDRLTVTTNLGDSVTIGSDHPLRFVIDAATDGVRPYVHIRGRLEARFTRAAALDLLAHVAEDATGRLGNTSAGAFFPLPDEAQP
jgi:hypothetical protein